MRKITKLCAAFAALLWAGLFASCSVDAIEEVNVNETKAVTVNAGIGADTRVVLAEEGTKLKTYWKDAAGSEEFSLYFNDGTSPQYLKFVKSNETTNAAGAAFTCSSAPASVTAGTKLYAAYPYVNKTDNYNYFPIDLSSQTGLLTSSDPTVKTVNDFNYMLAESTVPADGDLSKASFHFRNFVSILKLSLTFPSDAGTTISSASIVLNGSDMVACDLNLINLSSYTHKFGSININGDIALSSDKKVDLYVAVIAQYITFLDINAQIGANVYTARISVNDAFAASKMYHVSKTMTKDFNMYDWYTKDKSATEFTISNAYEMLALANIANGTDKANSGLSDNFNFAGKTVKLANDIDLSAVCGAGNNWNPIGLDPENPWMVNFNGTFDGQNKVIKNLYINTTSDKQGLFGTSMYGIFKNIVMEDVDVTGGDFVGAILGWSGGSKYYSNNVTLKGCTVSGKVATNGFGAVCGGIHGGSDGYVDIIGCTNNATISSTTKSYIGGLVGKLTANCNFEGCVNNGKISCGLNAIGGGLVGATNNKAYINMKASVNTGRVIKASTNATRGYAVGENGTANVVTESVYYVNYAVDPLTGVGTDRGTNNSVSLGDAMPADWTNVSGGVGNVVTALNTAWGNDEYEFVANGSNAPEIQAK